MTNYEGVWIINPNIVIPFVELFQFMSITKVLFKFCDQEYADTQASTVPHSMTVLSC